MRFLELQLYSVSSAGPQVYAGISVILLLISLIAILAPARQAMRIDPVFALRTE
jgi:ABC-type lipoprotein release transport system permease subunit